MLFRSRSWLAAALLLATGPLFAQEQVRIGIQAFRAKSEALAQWAPLAAALNKAMPAYSFTIETYTVDELGVAVASRRIDFILTNPSQFMLMDHRSGLSSPIVSLTRLEQGRPVSAFGGVIFTRSDRTDIGKLEDLRGKSVATASINSFGGYQMQAHELLLHGIRLPQDVRLIQTTLPQDHVVEAVLGGQADVGFVRTDMLEDMAREGRLDLSRIRVINQRNLPGFPARV